MSKYSRARNLVHARYTAKLANAVTRQLVESKAEALLQGKGNKDILSLLGKWLIYMIDALLIRRLIQSKPMLPRKLVLVWQRKKSLHKCGSSLISVRLINLSLCWYFSSTILLAGHETSATTLCWVLLEIAKNPDVQKKLRNEIRTTERAIYARGGSDFTAADLDNMQYLSAVIKVVISLMHGLCVHNATCRNRCVIILLFTKIIGKRRKTMFCLCQLLLRQMMAKSSRISQFLKAWRLFCPSRHTTGKYSVFWSKIDWI